MGISSAIKGLIYSTNINFQQYLHYRRFTNMFVLLNAERKSNLTHDMFREKREPCDWRRTGFPECRRVAESETTWQ